MLYDPATLFSTDFPVITIVLSALALVSGVTLLIVLMPRLSRVRRRVADDDESSLPDSGYPPVSVIVYSQADGANLRTLLPSILSQDYPAPMEVIVANDESADCTETVVSQLEMEHSNLYMTFAPERSRNLSRRKLSITLGIKAARYDAMMLTTGNSRIDSPLWLRRMMRHFIDGKQVVLGYSVTVPAEDAVKETARRRRSYDETRRALTWLNAALCHRPYMGTGSNLAYSRRLFFEHKGFSSTLNLNYGDDDLFVNEIATPDNTAVELSHESRVEVPEANRAGVHAVNKMRRLFTASMLPRRPFIGSAVISWAWWALFGFSIGAAVTGLPGIIPALAMTVLMLAVTLTANICWRRTSAALGGRKLMLTVPWLSLWYPVYNLKYRIKAWRNRRKNFTWANL